MEVKALDNQPELETDLRRVLNAFKMLSRSRPHSFDGSVLPIPLPDVLAGWQLTGMKRMGLTLQEWFDYVVTLDETVIEFYNKKRPQSGR